MSKHEQDVQGVALYLEFRREGATAQIVIVPDGLTGEGTGHSSSKFFRRVITTGVTKRKWRAYTIKPLSGMVEAIVYEHDIASDKVQADAVERFAQLGDYFDSLARNQYKLVKDTPIYVEVTKEDLLAASRDNLNTKLWNRIKSSRTALGFPEESVNSRI